MRIKALAPGLTPSSSSPPQAPAATSQLRHQTHMKSSLCPHPHPKHRYQLYPEKYELKKKMRIQSGKEQAGDVVTLARAPSSAECHQPRLQGDGSAPEPILPLFLVFRQGGATYVLLLALVRWQPALTVAAPPSLCPTPRGKAWQGKRESSGPLGRCFTCTLAERAVALSGWVTGWLGD